MDRSISARSLLKVSSFLTLLFKLALVSCSPKRARTARKSPKARTKRRRNVRRLGVSSCRNTSHTPIKGTATTTTIAKSEVYLLSSGIELLHTDPCVSRLPRVKRHPEKPANSSVLGQGIQASVVRSSGIDGQVRQSGT